MATAKKPTAPKKMGRPTKYTPELAQAICAELSMGKSLRTVCGQNDDDAEKQEFPTVKTIFNWLHNNEDFLQQYTRAKEEAADALADEILDISDDGSNDWMEKHYGDEAVWVTNGEALQRSKLRVDTRKFLMAKMKPKRYGDKLDVTSGGEKLPTPLLGGISVPKTDQDNS
jgi:hypothetical protein